MANDDCHWVQAPIIETCPNLAKKKKNTKTKTFYLTQGLLAIKSRL